MSNNSRKRKLENSGKPTYKSRFLIDGESPITPHPQILALNVEENDHQGPGRHRSLDLKGLILELVEEIYPPLVCPACFHTSNGRAEADLHLKEAHKGKKLFQCVCFTCEQQYSSKGGLRYHLEHNHQVTSEAVMSPSNKKPENSGIHKRPWIRSTLKNDNNSIREKRNKPALSDKMEKLLDVVYPLTVCPACKKEFKRKTHVVNHLVNDHHGQEPYKCIIETCKRTKAYSSREGLVYHLINYHE